MTDLKKQNSTTINSQAGLRFPFGCVLAKTRLVSAQALKTGLQAYGRKQFSVRACCRQRAQRSCKERRPRLTVQDKFAWPCKAKCRGLLGQTDSWSWLTSQGHFWFHSWGTRGGRSQWEWRLFVLFIGYYYCAFPHSSGMKLQGELYYSDLKQITESSDGKKNIKLAEER